MSQSVLRALSKDTLVYGIGDGMGRVIGLVLLPILSRIFGPADYGTLTVLEVSYLFAMVGMQLGANAGFQRFYFRREGEERRRLTASFFVWSSVLNLAFALAVWLVRAPLGRLLDTGEPSTALSIGILAWALPIEAAMSNALLVLRLNRRPGAFSALSVARVILLPTLTLTFVVSLGWGVPGVFGARAISVFFVTLAAFWLCRRDFAATPTWSAFIESVRFGAPGHPGVILKTLMRILPQYTLAYFAPLAAVGIFGIGTRLSSPIRVMTDAFHRAWNPIALQLEGDPREGSSYDRVVRLSALGLFGVSGLITVFSRPLVQLLTPEEFLGAAALIPWISLSIAADGVAQATSTLLYTRHRVRWTTYIATLRVLVFGALAVSLSPTHGAYGVSIAMAVSSIVACSVYLGQAHLLLDGGIRLARLGLACAVAVGAAVATGLEPTVPLGAGLGRSLATVVFLTSLAWALVREAEWRALHARVTQRPDYSDA